MTKVSITRSKLDDLATAISAKSGAALPLTIAQMQTAVESISPGGQPNLQTKTKSYTPSETAQSETVQADSGYDGMSSVAVSVGAIPSNYVGSGVTQRSSSDLTASSGIITAPSGYYESPASKAVSLIPYAIRPDAELVQSYTFDQHAEADMGLTIPSYTTTAQTLKAAANLSPTVTIDLTNYRYTVVERFLTIPEYSVSTKAKGRQEYTACSYIYDIVRIAANEFQTIIDATKKITSAQNLISTHSLYRLLYWSSSSAIALYATNSYGAYMTPTAPAVSGSTLTVKAPAFGIRGSTTYYTNTYMNATTDVRYQYVIEVYRSPVGNLNIDGWGQEQSVQHIIDCVNGSTHTLT